MAKINESCLELKERDDLINLKLKTLQYIDFAEGKSNMCLMSFFKYESCDMDDSTELNSKNETESPNDGVDQSVETFISQLDDEDHSNSTKFIEENEQMIGSIAADIAKPKAKRLKKKRINKSASNRNYKLKKRLLRNFRLFSVLEFSLSYPLEYLLSYEEILLIIKDKIIFTQFDKYTMINIIFLKKVEMFITNRSYWKSGKLSTITCGMT